MGWWAVIVSVVSVPLLPDITVRRGEEKRFERVWCGLLRLSLLCVREQYVFHRTEMKGTVILVMS